MFPLCWYRFLLLPLCSMLSNLSNVTSNMYILLTHLDNAIPYDNLPVHSVLMLRTKVQKQNSCLLQHGKQHDRNKYYNKTNSNLSASHTGFLPCWTNTCNNTFLPKCYNIDNSTNCTAYTLLNPEHFVSVLLVLM